MRYILVEFTKGIECQAYQEIDDNNVVQRYVDLYGNELVPPKVTESRVVTGDYVTPEFVDV